MATARLISEEYLNPNGDHHRGTSIESVNESYCPNDGYYWSTNIKKIANDLINKING